MCGFVNTYMRVIRTLLLLLILLGLLAAKSQPPVTLTVSDLTPKFLKFYHVATTTKADEAQRWDLWTKLYGFAAVPPTPEGQRMARKMLDDAWPRYTSALGTIRKGEENIEPPPGQILRSVAQLLGADVPIRAELLLFVGDFDNNAFTASGRDGIPTVALPVEGTDADMSLTHEFTHVVEAEQAGLSLGWERSLAHTIFAEGLAMRATENLHPGLAPKDYVGETTPNWYARAASKRKEILADVSPHLRQSDSATVMRYTLGQGGAGVEREAYYAGWMVIGDMLQHGWTFPRLARVTDAQMAALVQESLTRLQNASNSTDSAH